LEWDEAIGDAEDRATPRREEHVRSVLLHRQREHVPQRRGPTPVGGRVAGRTRAFLAACRGGRRRGRSPRWRRRGGVRGGLEAELEAFAVAFDHDRVDLAAEIVGGLEAPELLERLALLRRRDVREDEGDDVGS